MIIEDFEGSPESEEEGEDLMENMHQDYQPRPELDRYEQEGSADEQEFSDIDIDQRIMVDRELNERDKE